MYYLHLVITFTMVWSFPLYTETFICSFGLIVSSIYCGITRGRSRSRGQRSQQTPHSPYPPPITAFNTRIRQNRRIQQSIPIEQASPQAPIHLRSHSAPIYDTSVRAKHDISSHSTKKFDSRPTLPRASRPAIAASSSQTAPASKSSKNKEESQIAQRSQPTRSPLPRLRRPRQEQDQDPAQPDEVPYTRSVSPAPSRKSPSPQSVAELKKRSASSESPLKAKSKLSHNLSVPRKRNPHLIAGYRKRNCNLFLKTRWSHLSYLKQHLRLPRNPARPLNRTRRKNIAIILHHLPALQNHHHLDVFQPQPKIH